MAEESKKGVIVEFDFAVLNGAELLYQTTEALLKENDIPFRTRLPAHHLPKNKKKKKKKKNFKKKKFIVQN